jgi:hypothetical protein
VPIRWPWTQYTTAGVLERIVPERITPERTGRTAARERRLVVLLGAAALSLAFALPATATTIHVSDLSSDDTPASQLDANVSFDVVGTTLFIGVTNLTDDPAAFNISAIYFNSSDDIADLIFSDGPGSCPVGSCRWDVFASSNDTKAGAFGTFDWAIISNDKKGAIAPSDTAIFEFEISGSGPFDMSDFGTEFSTIPPGKFPSLVAVKFVQCSGSACIQNDDSAFGAAIPEPGTASLVLMGLLGLAIRGRNPRI